MIYSLVNIYNNLKSLVKREGSTSATLFVMHHISKRADNNSISC